MMHLIEALSLHLFKPTSSPFNILTCKILAFYTAKIDAFFTKKAAEYNIPVVICD